MIPANHNASSSSRHMSNVPTTTTDTLPPLSVVQTWTHRPQALTKATISDIHQLRSLVSPDIDPNAYQIRDVFMLNRWVCRNVELVGWVAGVDHKESSMIVTLDDGDGQNVLPLTIRLPVITSSPPKKTNNTDNSKSVYFRSARERANTLKPAFKPMITKTYARKDVRVGDTLRVVGKVEEWGRRKAGGGVEWIRGVGVDEGQGGSIEVVHPEEAYNHLRQVQRLHQEIYNKPFNIPPVPPLRSNNPNNNPNTRSSVASSSTLSSPAKSIMSRRGEWSDSVDMSSEIGSEIGYEGDGNGNGEGDLRLRDPSRLRPSQLTDRTFRQYLQDHMTTTLQTNLRSLTPGQTHLALCQLFPEYAQASYLQKVSDKAKGKMKVDAVAESCKEEATTPRMKYFRSKNPNCASLPDRILRPESPNTPKYFRSRTQKVPSAQTQDHTLSQGHSQSRSESQAMDTITTFTIPSLLQIPHLRQLASLVVDAESRRDERRRRRRVRDGTATSKDLAKEKKLKLGGGWKLGEDEKSDKILRLTAWVIREISEEGSLVQIRLTGIKRDNSGQEFGYVPLIPEIMAPLVSLIVKGEQEVRKKLFRRKGEVDEGIGIGEVVRVLRGWGEEGRWERVGEWVVKDGLEWAVGKEMDCDGRVNRLERRGMGYWIEEI